MLPGTLGVHCYPGPMERLRLAGAQINPVVGDLDGNVDRVLAAYADAADLGAHLRSSPSWPSPATRPRTWSSPSFLAASRAAAERVATQVGEAAAVVGFVEPTHAGLANAAALCHRGRVLGVYRKVLLLYGVFDEERYFVPGAEVLLAGFGRVEVAVTICEDLWFPWGPMATAVAAGAEVVVSLNASPTGRRRASGWSPCWPPGRPTTAPTSSTSPRSAARTSWSSTARAPGSTPGAAAGQGGRVHRGAAGGRPGPGGGPPPGCRSGPGGPRPPTPAGAGRAPGAG